MERKGKSCTIEFDGASKGNPGRSGAGVVLRDDNGKVVMRAREGLGSTTNNAAEYRALNRGMKTALEHGYTNVRVKGDSQLVSNQVNGKWKVKSPNLTQLYRDATELKGQFQHFKMDHVPREYNSEADAQAKRGVNLKDGQVEKEYTYSDNSENEIYSDYDASESESDNESSETETESDNESSEMDNESSEIETELDNESSETETELD